MRLKIILFYSFFYSFCFGQNRQEISGQVHEFLAALDKIEVMNIVTKKVVTTNGEGFFRIEVKVNDSLYFVGKEYYIRKFRVSENMLANKNLQIELTKKPEELKEVVVTKVKAFKLKGDAKWEQKKLNELAIEKSTKALQPTGVYMGTTTGGINVIALAGYLVKLIAKEKEYSIATKKPTAIETIEKSNNIKNLSDSMLQPSFFTNGLGLKEEEIGLFLVFCNDDPASKFIKKEGGVLHLMEYLLGKSKEFTLRKSTE